MVNTISVKSESVFPIRSKYDHTSIGVITRGMPSDHGRDFGLRINTLNSRAPSKLIFRLINADDAVLSLLDPLIVSFWPRTSPLLII